MNTSKKARAALLLNVFCFIYGLGLLASKFHYLHDERFTPHQMLEMLLSDSSYFLSWNLVIYLIYGLSLLYLTISLFFMAKESAPEIASGLLVIGGIWSGFMLLSGGLAIELINRVADIYSHNSDLAIDVWITGNLLHESLGGGNELIGAIWVCLISYLLPALKGGSAAAKRFGYVVTFLGLGTLFESTETFSSLFGVALILWFLLLYTVLPVAFATWKARE